MAKIASQAVSRRKVDGRRAPNVWRVVRNPKTCDGATLEFQESRSRPTRHPSICSRPMAPNGTERLTRSFLNQHCRQCSPPNAQLAAPKHPSILPQSGRSSGSPPGASSASPSGRKTRPLAEEQRREKVGRTRRARMFASKLHGACTCTCTVVHFNPRVYQRTRTVVVRCCEKS